MASRRNALGRGLGALLPEAPATQPAQEQGSDATERRELPIDRIVPNPDQPRRFFDAMQLEQLAASIRQHGVLQPVVVREAGGRYELLVGERRWRASKIAGKDTIPAVVAELDSQERLEVALVENVQRADLNPIELALAFRALADNGATQERIGKRVGLDRSTVANHLRILELPKEFQEDVESERISLGHAKALLQLDDEKKRRELRDRVVQKGLSVRETERFARHSSTPRLPRMTQKTAADPDLAAFVNDLERALQTKVRIVGSATRGKIEIGFFGAQDLQRIAGKLLGASH